MKSNIILNNISKTYYSRNGSIAALKNVSFDINLGDRVAILGPNGCGKTTLLNILSGFISQDSGSIMSNNLEVNRLEQSTMIFQDLALFDWKTVQSNICFALDVQRNINSEKHSSINKYIKLLGLSTFKDKYPYELSGGTKQKVAIARALSNNPKILLMDEPFASLDLQTKEILQEEINKILQNTDKTLILVTHDIDEALFLSNKIILMTSRPGSVKDIIYVKFPFPRNPKIRTDACFIELKNRIWDSLREEIIYNR